MPSTAWPSRRATRAWAISCTSSEAKKAAAAKNPAVQ